MKRLITFLVVSFCVSMGTATTATANPKALKEEHVRLSETSIAYDEQIARNIAVLAAQNQKYVGTHILEHDSALLKLANRLEQIEAKIGIQNHRENTVRS